MKRCINQLIDILCCGSDIARSFHVSDSAKLSYFLFLHTTPFSLTLIYCINMSEILCTSALVVFFCSLRKMLRIDHNLKTAMDTDVEINVNDVGNVHITPMPMSTSMPTSRQGGMQRQCLRRRQRQLTLLSRTLTSINVGVTSYLDVVVHLNVNYDDDVELPETRKVL